MLNFKGCGLPNVFLADGYHERRFEGGTAHSYSDIDGLYTAIGRAVAMSSHALMANEVRFLRKRLGWSQAKAGAVLAKTPQAVAKWEKGETPVPRVDGNLLRLAWLDAFSPSDVPAAVKGFFSEISSTAEAEYVFLFSEGKWIRGTRQWADAAIEVCDATIAIARVGYSGEDIVDVRPDGMRHEY